MSPSCTGNQVGLKDLLSTYSHLIQRKFCRILMITTLCFSSFHRSQSGDAYFESVCSGASLALLSFHAPMFRGLFGKLGMPCIVGSPNMSKTKEIKSAMHMASSHQYLFANKVIIIILSELRKYTHTINFSLLSIIFKV